MYFSKYDIRTAIGTVQKGKEIYSPAGSSDTFYSDQATIQQLVRTYGLTVSAILAHSSGPGHSLFLDNLATASGGQSFLVRSSPHPMDTFTTILESLMTILQSHEDSANNYLVYKNEYFTNNQNLRTLGSFRLDPWLTRDTSFGIYVPNTEDHLIRSVQFLDEHGQIFGPYSKMSTSFDLINYKTPNIATGLRPSFFTNTEKLEVMAGIRTGIWNPSLRTTSDTPSSKVWRYRIDWFEHQGDPIKSVIMVTSRSNKYDRRPTNSSEGDSRRSRRLEVSLTSWMSSRQWPGDEFRYLTLFARLTLGTVYNL